jgi:hypothetical protein
MEDPHRCIQDFVQALGAKSHFFHPPSWLLISNLWKCMYNPQSGKTALW